ncbi:hypothetical protein [Methanocella conradii]|uniref:hypothetical protein n=1 Tax=Methanocella conradii TaxID=1175444 RepID=UPI00157C4483|nr:hypothetical protein [Methanocella conradii]
MGLSFYLVDIIFYFPLEPRRFIVVCGISNFSFYLGLSLLMGLNHSFAENIVGFILALLAGVISIALASVSMAIYAGARMLLKKSTSFKVTGVETIIACIILALTNMSLLFILILCGSL